MANAASLAEHYHHGSLGAAVLAGLRAAGKDPDRLAPADLMGLDEFHIGGAQATREVAAQLALAAGMRLLDIGSGLGGPARHLAMEYGCHVTGVDLTAEYVAVAADLTRRMGLADRVAFRQGDAAAMELAPGSFDGATLFHVGMNIADKPALFAAVHRALKPGGTFAVHDVMQVGPGDLAFPVPWSSVPETSFVETPDSYRAALQQAGFAVAAERARGQFAREFFATLRARMAGAGGPPPIGLHVVMGSTAPQKVANMVRLVEEGVIAPVEMIARR